MPFTSHKIVVMAKKPSFTPISRSRRVSKRGRVAAAEFKATCLELMDRVRETGGEYVVTKHGKPVAKLIPVETGFADLIGRLEGRLRIKGKVLSTGLRWNAES